MTKISNKILALMVIAGALVFSSCDKDDDDDKNENGTENTDNGAASSIKYYAPKAVSITYGVGKETEETWEHEYQYDSKGILSNWKESWEDGSHDNPITIEGKTITMKSPEHDNQFILKAELNGNNMITKGTYGDVFTMSYSGKNTEYYYRYVNFEITYNSNNQISEYKETQYLGAKKDNETTYVDVMPDHDEDYEYPLLSMKFNYDEKGNMTSVSAKTEDEDEEIEIYRLSYDNNVANPKMQWYHDEEIMDWIMDNDWGLGELVSSTGLLGLGSTNLPDKIEKQKEGGSWETCEELSFQTNDDGTIKSYTRKTKWSTCQYTFTY